MTILYKHSKEAWQNYPSYLMNLVQRVNAKSICEIGGGANPAISLDFIRKHNIEYTILDISTEELAKAHERYIKIAGDITNPYIEGLRNDYDFVFSCMLAEHVADGAQFHRNINNMLKPGGIAFHFYPTLYSLPFLVNKILPESVADKILQTVTQGREKSGRHGKFPAYYNLCYGPTSSYIKRIQSLGYEIDSCVGFFGHDYFSQFPLLQSIGDKFASWLIKYPIPHLTSYCYLVVKKV